MPVSSEVHAQVATRVLRDLEKEMKKAIVHDSKGIGADLVAAIRKHRGAAPYGAAYRRLGRTAKVRTRSGRPPEVVVGGAGKFSGGGSVSELVWGYEYGSRTGDTRRGPGAAARADPSRRRRRRGRPLPQFPPWNQQGYWVNEVVDDQQKGPVLDAWLRIVDDVLAKVAR